ncbi:hypothetical protein [Pseudarthrobacter sp. GA104]|nr:hypothetical protein [Pseudarthrobacter sp. GA104]
MDESKETFTEPLGMHRPLDVIYTAEYAEGFRAFHEKRAPKVTGLGG